MLKRKLGQGLEVSSLGLGCMTMVGKDRKEMIYLLREVVQLGVNFFDTAEICGPYLDEELIGEALAPIRDQVIIATKCGYQGWKDLKKALIEEISYLNKKQLMSM